MSTVKNAPSLVLKVLSQILLKFARLNYFSPLIVNWKLLPYMSREMNLLISELVGRTGSWLGDSKALRQMKPYLPSCELTCY